MQNEPDAEHRDHARSDEEIEVGVQPGRGREDERGARIEPISEVMEHRLELRHHVGQKEQQDRDRRPDQEQRIPDRRIDALGEHLATPPILDDGGQHAVELAGGLAGLDHREIGRLDDGGMAFERLSEGVACRDRRAQVLDEGPQRLSGVFGQGLQRGLERQPRTDQQSELTQEDRDVARARRLLAEAESREPLADDTRLDRQVTEIFDAPDHFLARGRLDLAGDHLPGGRNGAILELRHGTPTDSLRRGRSRRWWSTRSGTWQSRPRSS